MLLIVLVLVAAALIGGFLIGRNHERGKAALREGSLGVAAVTTTTSAAATPVASPECKTAVDRADKSLTHAVQVERNLAEHTKIMNDLLRGKIDGDTALKMGTPSLIRGGRRVIQVRHRPGRLQAGRQPVQATDAVSRRRDGAS